MSTSRDHETVIDDPRRAGVVFAVLSVGVLSFGVLQSMLGPALTVIQGHLHTSASSITWIMTAYFLSAAVATPILGRLGDIYGKKHVLLVALAGLVVGSLVGALATSIEVMIVARVIQGLGGGMMPLAFGIIRDEFPAEKVSTAIGAIAAMVASGVGIGTVLSGVITDSWGYQWLFWLPAIVVGVAALAVVVLVPESPVRSPGKVNFAGALLLSGWLVALLLPVSKGSEWGWSSGRVLGPIALAVLLFVGWIMVESRAAEPLVDMRLMRLRPVWTLNLASLLFGFVLMGFMSFLPLFVQTPEEVAGYGFTATVTESGLFLLPMTVAMMVAGPVAGWLTSRAGGRGVVIFGAVAVSASSSLFAISHDTRAVVYVVTALAGLGVGSAFSAMSALIVTTVRPEQVGIATGMNANVRTVGGSIGVAVMTAIVTSSALPNGMPMESGYANGFWFFAAMALVAMLAAFLVRSQRPDSESAEPVPVGATA